MKEILRIITVLFFIVVISTSCDKDRGIVFMSISNEVKLGKQLDSTSRANPTDYPILDIAERMKNLKTGSIQTSPHHTISPSRNHKPVPETTPLKHASLCRKSV